MSKMTPTMKAFASRFEGENPVLVAPSAHAMFEGCLAGLAGTEGIEKLSSEEMSSGDSDFWFSPDDWRSTFRPYKVKDGILTIPVKGVLLSNFSFQLGSWATGYQYIWQAFKRGMGDADVKGIALVIHSPGGEVAENFDLVDKMFALRGVKPVRAFAHEYAYSAAYSIASVADHVVMSRTGGVGSIGVVTSHVDVSKLMEDIGYKYTFIFAGKHKVDGNPYESLKPEVQERIQSRIDELYDIFVATVARNRGIDEKAIRDTEALTYSASEAVSKRLADSVGPLDDAVAAFAADLSTEEGDEQMSTKTDAAVDQAAIDTARNEGMEAGRKDGHAAGMKEGAEAERQRISAILDSEEAKQRPAAARMLAFDTDKTPEAVAASLAKLPEEKVSSKVGTDGSGGEKTNGQKFNAAMSEDKPNVGGGDANDEGNTEDADSADAILALAASLGTRGIRSQK